MSPPTAVEPPSVVDTQIATLFGPLSINGIPSRRAKAPKLNGGLAAVTSSDMFKSPGHGKPNAKRWGHRITAESKSRQSGSLKDNARYLNTPGLISLGGGLPSSEYFPLERIDIQIPAAPHFSETVVKSIGKHDIAEGKSLYDLHVALNYGQGTGSAQMLRFVTEHTEIVHNPPYRDWQCCLSVGNTSALDIAYRMLCNRGDFILTEEYTFSSAIETCAPMGVKAIGIKIDDQGIVPGHMDELLTNWDEKARGAKKPYVLYTVPTGQNPTGATQSEKRRRELYRCAQKHDIYILEDEPYYFLQMQTYVGPNAPDVPPPASHQDFLKALVPSFLSMDVDGRVMRLDSFSKVIAPGTRTGWITASEQIVERFIRHSECSVQNPSGIAQIVLFKLLDETWGHAGYLDWLLNLRLEYTKRRDVICNACEEFMPKEVASWNPPMAGMFQWIKIDWTQHPHASTKTMLQIEDDIYHAAMAGGVLCTKGSWFLAEGGAGKEMFFRTTFASAPSAEIVEAIKRFAKALRLAFALV